MTTGSGFLDRRLGGLPTLVDRGLYGFAAFVLPASIAILSVWALWFWNGQFASEEPTPVSFSLLQLDPNTSPELAWEALQAHRSAQPLTLESWDTRLSEEPVWLWLSVPSNASATQQTVEFPSRHATRMQCWTAETAGPDAGSATQLVPAGSATRTSASGAMQAARAGFSLTLPPTVLSAVGAGPTHLLCQAQFMGPARFSAAVWESPDLAVKQQEFQRYSGLLDGGLMVLAAFVLIAGLINRETNYLLFASWLVVNLRMAALSAGWDHQWLGQTVPYEVLVHLRPITLALYYVVTFALFRSLFRDELERVGNPTLLAIAKWTCPPLLVLAVALPYAQFLPIIWVSTGLGIGILVVLLAQILHKTRSAVAMWYAASIGLALMASLYEVIAASLGLKGLIGAVNSSTAALASSLLTSLAIAQQMRQEHEERLSMQAELKHAYEVIPIGLFTLDLRGRFTSANPAMMELLGVRADGPGEHRWHDHFGVENWYGLLDQLRSGMPVELEMTLPQPGAVPHGEASVRRVWLKAALSGDKIEGSLQDVSEKARATEHLQFLASHDPLTKVLNRRGIEAALQDGLDQLAQGHALALAYLDLDRFKLINDLYGHNAGDVVLQQVCKRVQRPLSGNMALGRVGGDEFLLVMRQTPLAQAEAICRDIVASLSATPYQVGERAFQVRGSIGLIEVGPGTSAKDALSVADRTCREAKSAKSSQIGGLVVYDRQSRLFDEHEAELELVERLSTNQSIDGMFLEMQPIMSLRAPYASLNFEVLLRMHDAEGNRVPTERLIHAGENAGRMGVIDRWVISSTIDWLHLHGHEMEQNQFVCLNLSGASLNDEKFMEDVFVMLARHPEVTQKLCLEITESVALHDLGNTRRFIDKVRSFGAKVALDDFGAGYTSFSYLKDLPADLLKIDGSFIVNMNRHPANVAIVEAIVSLAQNLGMKTVAEWAEDAETVETLAEIGVDFVQGFVVARPQVPSRLLQARSSAAFIEDASLNEYLGTLRRAEDDEFPDVDLVLGGPAAPEGPPQPGGKPGKPFIKLVA